MLTRLSQGHLNLLSTCPPQFQAIYLEQLSSLPDLDTQIHQNWGSRFHFIMQQRELGLPIANLLESEPLMLQAVTSLIENAPELFQEKRPLWREAEHCRSLMYREYLLTAVYDLLIARKDSAQIIDWKTYRKPQNSLRLAQNWQTKLYLYLLAETSDYSPTEISMTYWFISPGVKPQSLTFNYDRDRHQQTTKELNNLLDRLQLSLAAYAESGQPFEHFNNTEHNCYYCQARQQRRSPQQLLEQNLWVEIGEIEEVSL